MKQNNEVEKRVAALEKRIGELLRIAIMLQAVVTSMIDHIESLDQQVERIQPVLEKLLEFHISFIKSNSTNP